MTALGEPTALASSRSLTRMLIVNADDFGRSLGINRGVVESHDHGIVTSASLMTLWPASADAAAAALARPELSIGLHVDLGEWEYRRHAWQTTYLRVALDDRTAVEAEVDRQLQAFRRLLQQDPTHLDSHQHVHREEPLRSILSELAQSLGVPLRHDGRVVRYCGEFFGHSERGAPAPQRVTAAALAKTVAALTNPVTELACHPGYATDVVTSYRREREIEVRTLCDSRVRSVLENERVILASFRALSRV